MDRRIWYRARAPKARRRKFRNSLRKRRGDNVSIVVAPDTMTDTDAALLARYARGDREAFAEFYDRHRRGMYGYALSLCGDEHEATDLAQELWTRLIENPGKAAGARNPRAYLYASLRHLMIDRLRKRKLEARTITEAAPASPLVVPRDGPPEGAERLDRALRRLPPEQREVVLLRAYGDLSFAEIADVLEENARTVESRHRLAMEKLREWLASARDRSD